MKLSEQIDNVMDKHRTNMRRRIRENQRTRWAAAGVTPADIAAHDARQEEKRLANNKAVREAREKKENA